MTQRPSNHSARDAAVRIVQVLREHGHAAYLAGGCVRDALLGLTPKDYDVATDALPDHVRELFRNSRFVGEAFGVVLVRQFSREVEVATFRTESNYEDGRRPSHVEFTDAEHDAKRRDFTINGLFEDPLAADPAAAIIDYVGGRADLKARLLRAIGDADARFAEDYLRMLRAARFASRFGFTIDEKTGRAIRLHAHKLGQISRERIGVEVQLMLTAPTRGAAAQLIRDLHLDAPALTEVHRETPLETVSSLVSDASYAAALTAWMIDRHAPIETPSPASTHATLLPEVRHFLGKEAAATLRRWRKALCLSNDEQGRVHAILALLSVVLEWPALRVAHRKRAMASHVWDDSLAVLRAMGDRPGVARLVHQIDRDAVPLLKEGIAPKPWITGDDLIEMGLKPGPVFKRLLIDAYDAQLEHAITSRREAVAWVESHR
ncbi:MAG: CCA tRNA nucleotidyltransferase [Planctomycetes bacterium]|nr:CCA tRNA nucleotidyltransferase [Planctomycetota bacterium]